MILPTIAQDARLRKLSNRSSYSRSIYSDSRYDSIRYLLDRYDPPPPRIVEMMFACSMSYYFFLGQ